MQNIPNNPLAYVYVIQNSLGIVKIGIANNPTKRFKAISANSGLPVTAFHLSPLCLNYQAVEKALLAQFKEFRVEGEWFKGIDFKTVCNALDGYFSNLPVTVEQANSSPLAFTFNNHQLRTLKDENGEIWFCLKDACDILEIKDFKIDRLDAKGVILNPTLTDGGTQKTNFVNEPNLYRVIFRSDKPQAKAFQDWVFSEVLPSIRKTGGYGNINHDLTSQLYELQRQVTAMQAVQTELLARVKPPKPLPIKKSPNDIDEQLLNSIYEYVKDKEFFTVWEVLIALKIKRDRCAEMRVGAALRSLGFKRIRKMSNSIRCYVYDTPIHTVGVNHE